MMYESERINESETIIRRRTDLRVALDGQHDGDDEAEFNGFSDCSSTLPKVEKRKTQRSKGIQLIIRTAKYMS